MFSVPSQLGVWWPRTPIRKSYNFKILYKIFFQNLKHFGKHNTGENLSKICENSLAGENSRLRLRISLI